MDLQSTRSIAKLSIVRLTVQPAAHRDVLPTIKYFTSLCPLLSSPPLSLALALVLSLSSFLSAMPRHLKLRLIYLKPKACCGNNVARLDLISASTTIFFIITFFVKARVDLKRTHNRLEPALATQSTRIKIRWDQDVLRGTHSAGYSVTRPRSVPAIINLTKRQDRGREGIRAGYACQPIYSGMHVTVR